MKAVARAKTTYRAPSLAALLLALGLIAFGPLRAERARVPAAATVVVPTPAQTLAFERIRSRPMRQRTSATPPTVGVRRRAEAVAAGRGRSAPPSVPTALYLVCSRLLC